MAAHNGTRVLVVDDSSFTWSFVMGVLGQEGMVCIRAENGQVAYDKINSGEEFDLILLDWNMPVLDGIGLLEKLKSESKYPCPIVMMTTENEPARIFRAMSLGAAEYIMKPFTPDILLEKIRTTQENE